MSVPKIWPFEEAQKVADRLSKNNKKEALFETGYGPSGLPHIGTFGEVARTTWVRQAFTHLTGLPSRLIAFSDDMDGLRKAPENVPNADILEREFIGVPLCCIPDPFETHESFAAHNNAMLRDFLDKFGFDYTFIAASDYYISGGFDDTLQLFLENHDKVVKVVAPTLRERRDTYTPFMPIHPVTGRVMMVPLDEVRPESSSIIWTDPDTNIRYETMVKGGNCKLQWKADWAMRWLTLGVDYEMSGKDLIDSVTLSSKIVRALGGQPPVGYTYELFLDENGEKISKSRGNGLSVDEWLQYGPPESLAQFMFNKPHAAKRLYFDVISRTIDEYMGNIVKADNQTLDELKINPVWHISNESVLLDHKSPISFALLLTLVGASNATNTEMVWGIIQKYDPTITPMQAPYLNRLVGYALRYYLEKIVPTKKFRTPEPFEITMFEDLNQTLEKFSEGSTAEDIMTEVYEVGKRHYPINKLRDFFACLYQVLLGQDEGPRFGQFVALYGVSETITLIQEKIR